MSNNRFSCLKPPDSIDSSGNPVYGSRNKFKRPKKTNSRWKDDIICYIMDPNKRDEIFINFHYSIFGYQPRGYC